MSKHTFSYSRLPLNELIYKSSQDFFLVLTTTSIHLDLRTDSYVKFYALSISSICFSLILRYRVLFQFLFVKKNYLEARITRKKIVHGNCNTKKNRKIHKKNL